MGGVKEVSLYFSTSILWIQQIGDLGLNLFPWGPVHVYRRIQQPSPIPEKGQITCDQLNMKLWLCTWVEGSDLVGKTLCGWSFVGVRLNVRLDLLKCPQAHWQTLNNSVKTLLQYCPEITHHHYTSQQTIVVDCANQGKK